MSYVTVEYVAAHLPAALRTDLEALEEGLREQLLEDASADVDRAVGGPRDPATGRALAVLLLEPAQLAAVKRATVAAVAARLDDPELAGGLSDYLPAGVTLARPASRPPGPAVIEHLAGHGLLMRSACAEPPIEDVLP